MKTATVSLLIAIVLVMQPIASLAKPKPSKPSSSASPASSPSSSQSQKTSKSKVVVITTDNIDSIIDGSKNVLVKFYAPWCGHCKRLAPIYEQLAENFEDNEDVVIAEFNCDENTDICASFEIRGYPTLKMFEKRSTSPSQEFSGRRTLDELTKFVSKVSDRVARTQSGWREKVGQSLWHYLHTVAAKYPEEPTEQHKEAVKSMLHGLRLLYPCAECRQNMRYHLNKDTVIQADSREDLSLFLCKLHNDVNFHLHKPQFTCSMEELDKKYLANCGNCITDLTDQELEALNKHKVKAEEVDAESCGFKVDKWIQRPTSMLENGKEGYTLVLFWTVTCPVCMDEMPKVQELWKQYGGKNGKGAPLNIIAVTDVNYAPAARERAVKAFLDRHKINFSVATVGFKKEDGAYGKYIGPFKGVPAGLLFKGCNEVWRGWGFQLASLPKIFKEHLE